MVDNLSTTFHALSKRKLTSLSFDEILLPRYMNWPTNIGFLTFNKEMAPFFFRYIIYVLSWFM